MYPVVILVAMVGIGILMLIYVVPELAATFNDMQVELPLTTRIVIAVGQFVVRYVYLLPLIIIVLVIAVRAALKAKLGKNAYSKIVLKLPIIAPIIRNVNAAYTVRNLSSLISSGVSLPRALEITSGTLDNTCYKTALLEAKERVKKGEKFSEALQRYEEIYPATVIQMIAVGEETGETSSILANLADFYEAEVSETDKNLASVIEPILMIVIGGFVGFCSIYDTTIVFNNGLNRINPNESRAKSTLKDVESK